MYTTSRIGIYANNFHKLWCIFKCRELVWEMEQNHTLSFHLIKPSFSTSANRRLACKNPLDQWCHQSKRKDSGESEAATRTSHGSMGPPEHLNRLQHTCTPGTDLMAHQSTTQRRHMPRKAPWGSADPGIGRTDLWSADPGPPRGACPLVLEANPRVFRCSSHRFPSL
jgi:hypothetical protein